MSEDNNKKDFDFKSQTQDFDEHEIERNGVLSWLILFAALSIALIFHSSYSLYKMITDESIPLVVCPRTYDLDRPVIMSTLEATNQVYVQDRWLRGFVRTYIQSLFPRTENDAETFYAYIRDHSSGQVEYKYQSYIDSLTEIKSRIKSGQLIKFYPKTGDGVRIRPTQATGVQTEWAVEVDGYYNRGYENNSERKLPTIRLTVSAAKPTQKNPEGLVVSVLKIDDTIADLMSGRKKDDGK